MSSLVGTQQAIYDRLSGSAALQALGVTVYFDRAPDGLAGPHVVVGDSTEVPRDTLARRGEEGTETVHSWAPAPSGKLARQIDAAVKAALEGAPLTGITRCRSEFAGMLSEPKWNHMVRRFRLWTRA